MHVHARARADGGQALGRVGLDVRSIIARARRPVRVTAFVSEPSHCEGIHAD